jgi:RNA polymerase sigma factor (sigma-70 family)
MAPEHAFDRLYRRHARDVYRFAYGLLRNRADAEDVAQTAFLNAYRALERGHRPESPRNWLLTIARNVARQRFRQEKRRVQEVALDVDLAEAIVVEDDAGLAPEDVSRALNHLSPNQRTALVLREVEGYSYAEIATALDLSVSAVETLIFRGRRALREQLELSLTCGEARRLIADGGRSRQLRAHLRECAACSTVARRTRAQRSALRSLFGLPWLGGGSATIAAKVATVVVATGIAGGLTELLAPPAGGHAHHGRSTPARMPIAAAIEVPSARSAAARRPVAAHVRARSAVVAAAARAVQGAPIRSSARPDAEERPASSVAPPAVPPAPTASTPAPAPAAAPAPPAPAAAATTTNVVTETTATVTVEAPVAPPVTVTVAVPSVPPVQPPDLTQPLQK